MLAGRRLFQGETDLDTLRQIQAARAPSLRQFNPHVSPDLDRLIQRALAREPELRYQTARDFGRDLNSILFHARRPVSSYDIADLVSQLIEHREIERTARGKDGGSIIESLIEEALFEFVSLRDSGTSRSGSQPVGGTFKVGMAQRGAGEIGDLGFTFQSGQPSGDDRPSTHIEVGNLALLEDEDIAQSKLMRAIKASEANRAHQGTQFLRNLPMFVLVIAIGLAVGWLLVRRAPQVLPNLPQRSLNR
jgi:serine/threonine-protein kinase